jgi:hypothetical protein
MSTLQVTTIRHNTAGFNNVVVHADGNGTENGKLARAWVNFNGVGTVAIRGQFNVNSITDRGTGEYTVNLSNAMNDSNYAYTSASSSWFMSNAQIQSSSSYWIPMKFFLPSSVNTHNYSIKIIG